MGTVCKCLFQFCCDVEEEQMMEGSSYADEPTLTSSMMREISTSRSMSRGSLYESQQSYQIAPQGSQDGEEEEEENGDRGELLVPRRHQQSPSSTTCYPSSEEPTTVIAASPTPTPLAIHEFFRRLRDRWRMYDSLEATAGHHPSSPKDAALKKKLQHPPPPSPLRQASSFDLSSDIPVISLEEVVLPGSDLQKEMARVMSKTLERHDDECVICMEGFDPTNPRMPTLCGCGSNQTYFHLPCLYQWVEQCPDCPSCRQRLRWQEF